MRRFSLVSSLFVAVALAACSGATAPTAVVTPPQNTPPHGTPTVAVLDSMRLGMVDANSILHLYPDTLEVLLPHANMTFAVGFSGLVAFTNIGPMTDPSTIQALFGGFHLSSDNPAIVTPGGNCGTAGWPCMTLTGATGSANVTVSVGGKVLTAVVVILVQ
jgi:hypothetical protein